MGRRAKGAQPGNSNAVKHGLYASVLKGEVSGENVDKLQGLVDRLVAQAESVEDTETLLKISSVLASVMARIDVMRARAGAGSVEELLKVALDGITVSKIG